MNIAIVGSGLSGLHAASTLYNLGHTITLFEANDRIGGHIKTLRIPFDEAGIQHEAIVDCGVFMFDPISIHPYLYSLIEQQDHNQQLALTKIPLDFTLHINTKNTNQPCWTTSCVDKNMQKMHILTNHMVKNIQQNGLLNPLGYIQCFQDSKLMLEFFRFNYLLRSLSTHPKFKLLDMDTFLKKYYFSEALVENWILPQIHCWWGSTRQTLLNSSIQMFADSVFKVSQQPQYTFSNGVDKIIDLLGEPIKQFIKTSTPISGIKRTSDYVMINNTEFDAILLAMPPCAALKSIEKPVELETTILGSYTTTTTNVYLHTDDTAWMPEKESWSTINLIKDQRGNFSTFWVGRLHPLHPKLFLTWGDNLNTAPNPDKTITMMRFLRTLPTMSTVKASEAIHTLQGENRTWYCGAHVHALGDQAHSLWADNALKSGLQAAQAIHRWSQL